MAKKKMDGITEKHFTSFSEISGSFSTLDVYGQIIKNADVQPGASGILHPTGVDESLALARVVGYLDQGRCVRLGEPQVLAMPAPDGRADRCGWDPEQYVVWKNLPRNWLTLHVQFRTAGIHATLESARLRAADGRQLRADQIETILRECIPLAGGNNNTIDLSKPLQYYGLDKDGVVAFAGFVIGSADNGVQQFQFELPAGALDGITVSSKLSEVANLIQDQAVHK